ncbi:hypothetical protein PFISCL1PPCAC_28599, partial [Pristionchus fissidentatus]
LRQSFVHPKKLEIRLIQFYFDKSHHGKMVSSVLSNASDVLCSLFSRHLAFDKFELIDGAVKGLIQGRETALKSLKVSLATVLNDHGIVDDLDSDVASKLFQRSGFVVIK